MPAAPGKKAPNMRQNQKREIVERRETKTDHAVIAQRRTHQHEKHTHYALRA